MLDLAIQSPILFVLADFYKFSSAFLPWSLLLRGQIPYQWPKCCFQWFTDSINQHASV